MRNTIIGLRLILEGKALELAAAATEVKRTTQLVAEIQSQLTAMDLRSLETESRPVEVAPTCHQLSWLLSWPPPSPQICEALSFEEWLASVPAGAVPVYDLAAGDEIEIETEQAEADAAAAVAGVQAAAPAAFASPALGATAIPFRAARARVELPYPRPRGRADTVEPKDDDRS